MSFLYPGTSRSQDDYPKTGDVMQIFKVTPRHVVFWRGTTDVRCSQDYAGFLTSATIEQIEKHFSIKLEPDAERNGDGNGHLYYNVISA